MGDEAGPGDVVELGGGRRFRLPGWRPSRGAEILAVATLVVGLAAGYATGSSGARSAARPQPTVTVTAFPPGPVPDASFSSVASPALTQDPDVCAVQTGRDTMELGIQLVNESTQTLTLTNAKAVLPLGGLTQLTWQWGTCGALINGPVQGDYSLSPGQGAWLTVTFQVQLRCPAPVPVQFNVAYRVKGHSGAVSLSGFSNLGEVPYSGCGTGAVQGAANP